MTENRKSSQKFSRRDFLKTTGVALIGFTGIRFGLGKSPNGAEAKEVKANPPENREEAFRPFNKGIEWQYFQFQVENQAVFCSMVQINNPTNPNNNLYRLSVRETNLETEEVSKNTYQGTRNFDPETSTYYFKDSQNNTLAQFEYNEGDDNYLVFIHTDEFNTDSIDANGLTFSPKGPLIKESRPDGRFPIAQTPEGSIYTTYYSDNTEVLNSQGKLIGYGSRDSQIIEPPDFVPNINDFDHHWIHTWIKLPDGRRAAIKAWESKSGGNFRFATIAEETGNQTNEFVITQLNEESAGFNLTFIPKETEKVSIGENTKQLSRDGRVVVTLGGNPLFDLTIKTPPKQIISDETGLLGPMVEAHGRVVQGIFKNHNAENVTAIWESTTEFYSQALPLIIKQHGN